MNTTIIINLVLLIVGILININIKNLALLIFKQDGTLPRIPLRFLGIYLIINSISTLFHI